MKIKINYPQKNCKEDIQPFESKESKGFVSEVVWKGKFVNQWLLKIQKKRLPNFEYK